MRLFRVNDDGGFTEYTELPFKGEHVEKTLESWMEGNPKSIIEDGKLFIIGRQVSTNLNSYIDLLAIDGQGNVVVLELKRDRTPRETLAQALEYASFVADLDYDKLQQIFQDYTGQDSPALSEAHKQFFGAGEGEAVTFNKDQRIVIVGQDITPPIHQTAQFLRKKGLRVTCVEFDFFQTASGERLLSTDVVVGREPVGNTDTIKTASLTRTDKRKFMESCDESGRAVFEAILGLKGLAARWGSKGFSLNVDVGGKYIGLCYGYPPASVYRESVYTAFTEMKRNVEDAGDLVASFQTRFEQLGLFVPAGRELKYVIQQKPTENQLSELADLIGDLAGAIKARMSVESDEPVSK